MNNAVPNSVLQLQGAYASDSDSVVPATPEKQFNEQDGQSDGSDFHTPAQQSKRRRLPTVSPYKNRQILFLNRILMVFFSIFYSIPPHPASAVSSDRGSLARLSRNGPLLNAIGRLHTKKSRQLWRSLWTKPTQKYLSSPIRIPSPDGERSRQVISSF